MRAKFNHMMAKHVEEVLIYIVVHKSHPAMVLFWEGYLCSKSLSGKTKKKSWFPRKRRGIFVFQVIIRKNKEKIMVSPEANANSPESIPNTYIWDLWWPEVNMCRNLVPQWNVYIYIQANWEIQQTNVWTCVDLWLI